MNNIEEKFNVDFLTSEELMYIDGGQCDCEEGGRGAAKAVKAFFNGIIDALKHTTASSPYYYPGPKH